MALDDSGTQSEIAKRYADAGENERHARKSELMGREQVGENDRRSGRRHLRGRLPRKLPPHTPGDSGAQPVGFEPRRGSSNFLYHRTASSTKLIGPCAHVDDG